MCGESKRWTDRSGSRGRRWRWPASRAVRRPCRPPRWMHRGETALIISGQQILPRVVTGQERGRGAARSFLGRQSAVAIDPVGRDRGNVTETDIKQCRSGLIASGRTSSAGTSALRVNWPVSAFGKSHIFVLRRRTSVSHGLLFYDTVRENENGRKVWAAHTWHECRRGGGGHTTDGQLSRVAIATQRDRIPSSRPATGHAELFWKAWRTKFGLYGPASRAWSSRSHLPAVRVSPDVELTAVYHQGRQRRGGRYGAGRRLPQIASPEIDAVAVVVRVPSRCARQGGWRRASTSIANGLWAGRRRAVAVGAGQGQGTGHGGRPAGPRPP